MERDELQRQVNALQFELDKLRRAQATFQQSDELEAQVAKLQSSLAESERRASDLESEVAEWGQRAHDLEREVAEREKREHDLESEVTEREQREHDLQREVARLKRQVWNLESTATGLGKKTMQVFQQVVRAIFRQSTFFPDHLRRMVSSDITFLREHFQINDLQLTACELVITWPAVPFPLIKDFKRLVCFLKTRLSDLPKETRALVADPLERLRDVASRVVGPVEQVYDNASERTRQPSQTMGEGEMHTVQGREKFARGAPIDDEMALPSYIDDNGQSRIPDDEWWGLVYPNGNGSHVAASSLTSAGARTRRDAVPKPSWYDCSPFVDWHFSISDDVVSLTSSSARLVRFSA
jgi:cell division protein FtsL